MSSANTYVGIKLSKKEAMEYFGAKYKTTNLDKCPKDGTPSKDKQFCADCGKSLTKKTKVSDGITKLEEIEDILEKRKIELDYLELEKEFEGETGLILGKKILSTYDDHSGKLWELNLSDLEQMIQTATDGIKKLGIEGKPLKIYGTHMYIDPTV